MKLRSHSKINKWGNLEKQKKKKSKESHHQPKKRVPFQQERQHLVHNKNKMLILYTSRIYIVNKFMGHFDVKICNMHPFYCDKHTQSIDLEDTSKICISQVFMDLLLSMTVSLPTSRRPISFGLISYFLRRDVTTVKLLKKRGQKSNLHRTNRHTS